MEITRVYLYSKVPLTHEQESVCLADIGTQAREGFRVELQREVLAHTFDETFTFTVRRIEPASKFYGAVDGDTVFEIVHDEAKKVPICAPPMTDPDAIEKIEKLSEEMFPTEVSGLKLLIDDLETVRVKHGISWGRLRKVVEVVDLFDKETTPRT